MKFLSSKKAKAFLIGTFLVFLVQVIGLDEETAAKIVSSIEIMTVGYMGSQGLADIGKGKTEAEVAGRTG